MRESREGDDVLQYDYIQEREIKRRNDKARLRKREKLQPSNNNRMKFL
jgi:hypothetical protein